MRVTQFIATKEIEAEPFPHLVVENVLPKPLYDSLLDGLPPLKTLLKGQEYRSNQRFNYSPTNVAFDPSVADVWKSFVAAHLQQAFLDEMIDLFRPHILKAYPDFAERFKPLDCLRSGIRHADEKTNADVLLDAQIAFNTPVELGGTTVRGPHVDCPKKLFIGLLYFRLPGDESRGGELEIYKSKKLPPVLDVTRTGNLQDMELVRRVAYKGNTLVLLLNTPTSLHGVSVRSRTPYHRVFLNLLGEMREPLFALEETRHAAISAALLDSY